MYVPFVSSKFFQPFLVFTVLVVGCGVQYIFGLAGDSPFHAKGLDDAYISYRYAWNVIHHGTLSWNESGFRQVEGFTNPLWVLLSMLPAVLGSKALLFPCSCRAANSDEYLNDIMS